MKINKELPFGSISDYDGDKHSRLGANQRHINNKLNILLECIVGKDIWPDVKDPFKELEGKE